MNQIRRQPMPARPAGAGRSAAGRSTPGRSRGENPLLPPDAPPAAVLDTIRSLIGDDQVLTARRLAVEAAARFPAAAAIQNAKRILNDGKATPNPEVEPETGEEPEGLSNPPESAHGKGVALIGRQVVAMADTLVDLMASLRSSNLPRNSLIHQFPS